MRERYTHILEAGEIHTNASSEYVVKWKKTDKIRRVIHLFLY